MDLSQEQKFKFRLRLEQELANENNNNDYFSKENAGNVIADISSQVLPMAGAVGGAVIGSGLGPFGTVGGGAGGYAIGKQLSDIVDRTVGTRQPAKNYKEALISEPIQNIKEGVQQEAIGALLNPISLGLSRGISKIGKKSIASFFGPTEKAVEARFARPNDIINAEPLQNIGEDLAGTISRIEKVVSKQDDEAWNKLFKLKSEPRSQIENIIKGVRNELKITGTGKNATPIGQSQNRAYDFLNNRLKEIQQIKQPGASKGTEQMLDQRQMRELLQSIDNDINWEDQSADILNTSLERIRGKINELIKTSNPEYAGKIEELASSKALLENAKKKFSISKQGGEYVSSDTTPSKLKLSIDEKRARTREVLDQIKKEYGDDIAKRVEDRLFNEQFKGASTTGSRKTVLGGAIGAGVGSIFNSPVLGYLAGGATGAYMDTQCREIAGGLIDLLNKLPKGVIQAGQPLTRPFVVGAMGFNRKGKKK